MAGSQLKRLKASLRDQGIIGAQQSKKQKRKQAEDLKGRNDRRLQRSTVLENIREQFNPFQFKTNARGPKFDVTTNKPASERAKLGIKGRPGLSKTMGEQRRRETLLVEMERRNKVGGILDRRFGEDDPDMTPEEKMLQRFTLEKQRLHKKRSMFDLEEDDDAGAALTHFGRELSFDGEDIVADDFDEADLPSGNESESSETERKRLKRQRWEAVTEEAEERDNEEPERKKTKKEVMEEVIAKSKHHKYERQAAKEEDEDLRAELDKDLPDLRSLLFRRERPQADSHKDTKEQALIAGIDRSALEKDYDVRLRQMIQDQRAQPATRTKTEDELAEEAAQKLKELEEKRLRRMRGEQVSDDEDEESEHEKTAGRGKSKALDHDDYEGEEEDEFGLGEGIKRRPTATELGFDDEDDFIIDDDLVADGGELELEFDEDDDMSSIASAGEPGEEEDDDFTKYLADLDEKDRKDRQGDSKLTEKDQDGIPYTFECPESFSDLERVLRMIPQEKVPVVVVRIRALYHPKLNSRNKEKLANFSRALIRYISYISRPESVNYLVVETLIRHVHSLAKRFPIEIAKEFREVIQELSPSGDKYAPFNIDGGHLALLTAIGTIFPTSDHFHQVATPAMLVITRYLGQGVPRSVGHYATGAYLSILALQFQQLSKRYVPELMNFCLDTMCALAPEKMTRRPGFFPLHSPPEGSRIRNCEKKTPRKLNIKDTNCLHLGKPDDADDQKVSILQTIVLILKAAAETWSGKAAFFETFQPALPVIEHLLSPSCRPHLPPALQATLTQTSSFLSHALRVAHLSRRPLELHHHKPLAIKTHIPKFEDSFDPDKHYDPDRERAELAKLKAEHKRERKGAMRELRKDAGFLARENLRKKKATDEAYEKKFRRLVSEIQNEEGKESNDYEREKEARKKASKRR
jgi:nucleolar protein 14